MGKRRFTGETSEVPWVNGTAEGKEKDVGRVFTEVEIHLRVGSVAKVRMESNFAIYRGV